MDRLSRIIAGAAGVLFVLVGIGWLAAPSLVAEQFDMALLDGRGLSTQVADLAAFFLTAGACILVGLTTGDRLWFYPTILMLGLAAVGRVLAWLVHGAALTLDMIAVEAIVSTVLVFVARAPTSRDRA